MTEDTEHDPEAEDTEAPVSLETVTDEELAEEEESAPLEAAVDSETGKPETVALQELWDKRWKTHERLSNAYFKKIEDLWGDDAVKLTRWMIGPNSPYGYISETDVGRLPDDFKQGLETVLGTVREQDYEPDPFATQCPTCKGKGSTALPTFVGGKGKRECPTCDGNGYLIRAEATGGNGDNGYVADVVTLAVAPDIQAGDPDDFGEPKILPDGRPNPNFQKLPQHKILIPPYGITALLTKQG